jgi:hypothetical protein
MASSVAIGLYDDQNAAGRTAIELIGSVVVAGADVTITSVLVTVAGAVQASYEFSRASGAITIPAGYIDSTSTAPSLRLARGPSALAIVASMTLAAPAPAAPPPAPPPPAAPPPPVVFFGVNFSGGGTTDAVDLQLILSLPGPAASAPALEPPLAVLSCVGHAEASAGTGIFAEAAIGFRVVIDGLPAGFPSTVAPALEVVPPLEIPWPEMRLPWPEFPRLPFSTARRIRIPAFSAAIDPLPVRVGWKAIDLSVDSAGATTVHFQQLTLSGAP